VRLTPQERDSLARYARQHGSSLSAVLATLGRQVVLGGGDQVAVLAERSPDLKKLSTSLHRIGVSLNQLAHHANRGDRVSLGTVEQTAMEVRELVLQLREDVLPWV